MNSVLAGLWSACLRSATIAWSYVLAIVGLLLSNIDTIAAVIGDPGLSQQIATIFHADPKVMGAWTLIIGIVTTIARLRSIALTKRS